MHELIIATRALLLTFSITFLAIVAMMVSAGSDLSEEKGIAAASALGVSVALLVMSMGWLS